MLQRHTEGMGSSPTGALRSTWFYSLEGSGNNEEQHLAALQNVDVWGK